MYLKGIEKGFKKGEAEGELKGAEKTREKEIYEIIRVGHEQGLALPLLTQIARIKIEEAQKVLKKVLEGRKKKGPS
ncbi:MAG: hypothetical protein AAGI38_14015 [Bacteroidota bacterium]